jgi:hypothetical protein
VKQTGTNPLTSLKRCIFVKYPENTGTTRSFDGIRKPDTAFHYSVGYSEMSTPSFAAHKADLIIGRWAARISTLT